MKHIYFSVILLLSFVAADAQMREVQRQLDSVLETDQGNREKLLTMTGKRADSLWKLTAKQDTVNLRIVKEVLDTYGWLGIDSVGEKANLALFLVIQHSDSTTQEKYLPMMRAAVEKGDAKPQHLALLEDRVLTNRGKPQIYGSQVRTGSKGKYEFFPIEDEINVNRRRAEVGLEPLEQYAKNFGINYHQPK